MIGDRPIAQRRDRVQEAVDLAQLQEQLTTLLDRRQGYKDYNRAVRHSDRPTVPAALVHRCAHAGGYRRRLHNQRRARRQPSGVLI